MPAKDIYHDIVKNALIKDGWTITHDPYRLPAGPKDLYIDIGAERLLAAVRGNRKIAVEVKSFVRPSPVHDLEQALGQFTLYYAILQEEDAERTLYLAIREEVYNDLFTEPIGKILLDKKLLRIVVFDSGREVIVKWID